MASNTNTPTTAPLLVSVRDAASALGVSANTIGNLIRRGELPSVKVGARRLLDRRDLLAFVDSRKGAAQ